MGRCLLKSVKNVDQTGGHTKSFTTEMCTS